MCSLLPSTCMPGIVRRQCINAEFSRDNVTPPDSTIVRVDCRRCDFRLDAAACDAHRATETESVELTAFKRTTNGLLRDAEHLGGFGNRQRQRSLRPALTTHL